MLPTSPGLFLTAVRGAIRLGRLSRENYRERIRDRAYTVVLGRINAGNAELEALEEIYRQPDLWAKPGAKYERLFEPDAGGPVLRADVDAALHTAAIEEGKDHFAAAAAEFQAAGGLPPGVSLPALAVLDSWLDPNAKKRRYARLGLALADVAIEAVAAQPNLFGLSGKAETLVGALATNLQTLIGPDDELGAGDMPNFRERAFRVFLEASLQTAAEHPNLVFQRDHIAALAKNALTPLIKTLEVNRDRPEFISLNRLRDVLRGPVALAAIETLADYQTAFLGERFGADRVSGAVLKGVFAAALQVEPDQFDVRDVFSPPGLSLVLRGSLAAAAEHPELFIAAGGERGEVARDLLAGVAVAVRAAPQPFDARNGLAPMLAGVAIETGRDFVARRDQVRAADAEAGEINWANAAGDVLTSILGGFSAGVSGPGGVNPFLALGRENSVGVVRIIAAKAAVTPGLVANGRATPELKAISAGIARLMTQEKSWLLTREDWRIAVAALMDEAARNPHTLFSPKADAAPDAHFAVKLTDAVFAAAPIDRALGQFLFGVTLRQALIETYAAGAKPIPDKAGAVQGVAKLLESLNAIAAAEGRPILNAYDWSRAYAKLVNEAVLQGSRAKFDKKAIEQALA